MARVTVRGLSALRSDLDTLSTDLVEGVREAQKAVAEALAGDIRTDAPVDTGRLRNSVEVQDTDVVLGGDLAPYAADVEERDPFIKPNIESIKKYGVDVAEKVLRKEIG